MSKRIEYYISKLTALRNAQDELLREMEDELSKQDPSRVPRKRQNKKSERVLSVDAWYERRKRKTA